MESYLCIFINMDSYRSENEVEISKGFVKDVTFSNVVNRVIELENYHGFVTYKIPEISHPHIEGKVKEIDDNNRELYINDDKIGSVIIKRLEDTINIDIELLPEYRNIELHVEFNDDKQIITLLGKKLHLRPYSDAWLYYVDGKRRVVRIA